LSGNDSSIVDLKRR